MRIMGRMPRSSQLVIDYTGVGKPVFDMFERCGHRPIGVTITAGGEVKREGSICSVPKLVLISGVQALLHSGRLKIRKDLPEVPALISELQDFRAEVTDSGYWRFGARAGKHDDLVLAMAIALWQATSGRKPLIFTERDVAIASAPGLFTGRRPARFAQRGPRPMPFTGSVSDYSGAAAPPPALPSSTFGSFSYSDSIDSNKG